MHDKSEVAFCNQQKTVPEQSKKHIYVCNLYHEQVSTYEPREIHFRIKNIIV